MIFEIDPIEEADRAARLLNETNHCKKREINGYNRFEVELDQEAIDADRYKDHTNSDKKQQKNLLYK